MSMVLLGLVMLLGYRAEASHVMGGQITYTNVAGTNTYFVTLTMYRDCAGIAAPTSVTVSATGTGLTSVNINMPRISLVDITPLCPGQVSRCVNSSAPYGVQEAIYRNTTPVTLNPNVNGTFYNLSFTLCCRNAAITTVNSPGSQNSFFSATLDPSVTPRNNSPTFLNRPVAFICVNQPATISPNASDLDGDALVYSLTACRNAVNTNLPYAAGFSAINPISSSTGVTINPGTGELTFTPSVANQVAVICIKAEEFRNNVKIGEIVRDIQVRVLNCSNAAPVIAPIGNAIVPVGQTFCVNVSATDDISELITLTATSGIIPPATFVPTTSGPGFANGIFCFTPDPSHEGNTYTVTINAQDDGCPAPATGVETFNITVPAVCRVDITASATDATCGAANGSATASLNGGVGPYQYSWTGPGGYSNFTQTINNLVSGTYCVTIVDGNSCVDSACVTVGTVGGNIGVTTTVVDANCGQNNGSITVNASGGTAPYSYSLNGGAGQASNTFSGLGTGNYTVGVTDANACSGSANATVNQAADVTPPVISCQGDIAVNNDPGQCGASVSFAAATATDDCGSATVTQTSGGASGSFFAVGGPSTISFTAVDGSGNTASCSFTITVSDNEAPVITCPSNITVNNAPGQCGANVSHSASATDNCTATVSQTSGISSGGFNPVGTSSVAYTAVDASGNSSSCSFTVTVVDNEAPNAVCQNHTVNISSGGSASFTAAQFDGGSTDNCGIASISASPLSFDCSDLGTNAVALTVVDVNGNSSGASCSVTVTNDPISVSLSASVYNCGFNVSCNGATDGSVSSSVSGGCAPYSYAWSNSGSGAGINNVGAGSYSVVVTDGNGNTATASITLTEPAALAVSLSGTDVTCFGGSDGSVSSSVNGGCAPYSYSWSNGASSSDLSGVPAGTYTVTVTDANGCSSSASYTVDQPTELVVTVGPNQSVIYGYGNNANCVTLTQTTSGGTPAYTGVWTDGNNNVVSANVCPTVTTTYCYTATDANGCTATACMTVCVLDVRCAGSSNNGNNGGNSGGQGGQGWINGGAPQHVTVCHTPPGRPGTSWIQCLPPSAVPQHLAHGDYLGACGVGGPNFTCTSNKSAMDVKVVVENALAMETYPNPTNGALKVSLTCEACNDGNIDLQVVDALGKLVSRSTVTLSGGRAMSELNLSSQGTGFYFIIASDGNSRVIEKVMKN